MSGDKLRVDARSVDDRAPGNEHHEHKSQTQFVARHRRASHPAVTTWRSPFAHAIAITDSDEPGNSMAMPRIPRRESVATVVAEVRVFTHPGAAARSWS
jgi:hypothetical protein